MKLTTLLILSPCVIALMGCLPDVTEAGFQTPSADGTFDTNFVEGGETSLRSEDRSGNGFAYTIGVTDDSFLGQGYPVINVLAGVLPTSRVSDTPTSGTATFVGTYEAVHLNLQFVDPEISIEDAKALYREVGAISLDANFNAHTLTGHSGELVVDGTFSGAELAGTVTYEGFEGDLEGLMGGDGAVGVFVGEDLDEVLVGGFVVDE